MKIIIVDDDKLVSASLKTILETSGDVHVCRPWDQAALRLSLYMNHIIRMFC